MMFTSFFLIWYFTITDVVLTNPFSKKDLIRPDRIVGGEPVNPGDIPWQVSLQIISNSNTTEGSHFCGGTLILPSWVVTAAHCTNAFDYRQIVVVTGAWNITENNTQYRVQRVFTNNYDPGNMENDIALLKLDASNPIKLVLRAKQVATPIRMETEMNVTNASSCLVSGWGRLVSDGNVPDVLHAAKVALQSDEDCTEKLATFASMKVRDSNICAGGGDTDSCQGDSGGPLVCCIEASSPDASTCRLVGVTSWGIGCATPGLPGIYTEVSHYVEWINNIIKDNDNA